MNYKRKTMHRRSTTRLRFWLSVVYVLSAVAAGAADQDIPKRGAASHDELGKKLIEALSAEDYPAVQQLMIPPDIVKTLGAPPEGIERHRKEYEGLPELAAQYAKLLKKRGILPEKTPRFQKFDERDGEKRTLNGVEVLMSTGVRTLDAEGNVEAEIIDRAIRIEGRWYIWSMVTEAARRELMAGEAAGNEKR